MEAGTVDAVSNPNNWELILADEDTREAANAIASFDLWYRLRGEQRLSRKRSIAIIVQLLADLIGER